MEIHWDELSDLGPQEREAAEAHLRRIAAQHDDLLSIRIAGHTTGHHQHGGREVHIIGHAKGREIAASRTRPDLGKALHDALGAFERELRRLRSRRSPRHPEHAHGPSMLGLVDRISRDEGYGFALIDDGRSVYFHRNALSAGLSFETLEVGQRIGLSIEAGRDGLQATVVVPAGTDTPMP
jgi:cold shock CspA family protein/ribosome-associated translation inhibitor RaiA